jgi:hypothetical protein
VWHLLAVDRRACARNSTCDTPAACRHPTLKTSTAPGLISDCKEMSKSQCKAGCCSGLLQNQSDWLGVRILITRRTDQ